jgi:hypothetical protein
LAKVDAAEKAKRKRAWRSVLFMMIGDGVDWWFALKG